MRYHVAVLGLLLACLVSIPPAACAQEATVGFQDATTPDGVEVGIWYPSQGRAVALSLGLHSVEVVPGGPVMGGSHALVVISHGTGGGFSGHADTAEALARAGFIVAALTHPGDNWRDQSRVAYLEDRPAALSRLIDYMLGTWPGHGAIAVDRIGAFGFSAGGYTVLAAAGAKADFRTFAPHCRQHPQDFDCRLLGAHPREGLPTRAAQADRRIKALVVAAPAMGFAFGRAGLADLRLPVQLWRADSDQILPAPDYADAVRAALPVAPEFHPVPLAGHFDFLAPCDGGAASDATLCASAPGFDRIAFHQHFNAEVVRFFTAQLGR